MLAIPYRVCAEVLPTLAGALTGRIVIDATNPLHEDYSPINLASTTSAGEEVAAILPGSRTVKAFNTVFADVMSSSALNRRGRRTTAFVASDDVAARAQVMTFAHELGFAPVSAGPLSSSRYLEAIAHLNIRIAFAGGGGTNAAFLYDQASKLVL